MFGKTTHVTSLALRKRLLIAESELNRAQLSEEWQAMRHGVLDLTQRAKTVATWASSAAVLVSGIAAMKRGRPEPGTAKSSWFSRILKGVRLASTIWFAVRGRGEK